jgi:hypothetical protein
MRTQSLLFAKSEFTVARAKAWAKKHGKKYGDVDVGPETIHLRQEDPRDFDADSFRTITLRPGVQARVGCPKTTAAHEEEETAMAKHKNRKKNPMGTGAKVGLGIGAAIVLGAVGFVGYRVISSNKKAKANPTTFIAGRRYDIVLGLPIPIPTPTAPSVADAQKALDQVAAGSFTVIATSSTGNQITVTVDVLKDTAEPARLPPPLSTGNIVSIVDKGITPKGIVSSMQKPALVARVG